MSNVATSCTIAAYTGWPYGSDPFYVVVSPGTAAEEKVLVTRTGSTDTTLNVVSGGRGADDTSAQSHDSGAAIYPVFTAVDALEANTVASTQTTKGDLLVHTGSAHDRLAAGTNDYILVADSGETTGLKWAALDDTAKIAKSIVDAKGDLISATADDTPARLAVGTNGYVLEADSGESTGLKWSDRKSVELNAQTGTTYTFVLGDAGKVITATNASPVTVTVPPEASVAFANGTQIVVAAGGAGAVTIAAGSGVTLNSKDSDLVIDGQYATACCLKTGTDTWLVFGALTT
jgi:uncharacterized protein YjlB